MDTLPDPVGSSQMDIETSQAGGTPEVANAAAKPRVRAPVRVEGMFLVVGLAALRCPHLGYADTGWFSRSSQV